MAAVGGQSRRCLDPGKVGTGARFRHRDGGHQFTGEESGKPPRFLFVVAVLDQIGQDEARVDDVGAESDPCPCGLLTDHGLILEARLAAAAILLR